MLNCQVMAKIQILKQNNSYKCNLFVTEKTINDLYNHVKINNHAIRIFHS